MREGNVFSGGVSQTGGSADRKNNVEVIRVNAPTPGTWTIRVTPFAVPQPTQGYALVATGKFLAPAPLLERVGLTLGDSVGGDGDGCSTPGNGWISR